jgi:Flp pilus assembly pilin Flp
MRGIIPDNFRRAMPAGYASAPEGWDFCLPGLINFSGGSDFMRHLLRLWREEEGQDIAEYAVMLAVILVIVVGTIRLIGSNANNVFSNVASSIQ